jgi:hypothetical protein
MGKLSSVLASALVLLVIAACSLSMNQEKTASAQEGKKAATISPAGDEGSADKKDDPDRSLSRFMRQKLQASTMVLEGLCTEDLTMVSDGAKTLMKMSGEEKWRVSNDMMYKRYSTEFVNAVQELQHEADDNDMDGTSLAWVNVTMKCLKCHEWVRNTVIADSDK